MTDSRRKLDQIQRWMQAVITHPDGVQSGVHSPQAGAEIPEAADDLEGVVLPSKALTSTERLSIYAGAYYGRLLECMREFFPALTVALGEELFDEFAFDYLQQYPSQSYTLNRLADHFVEYLEQSRPDLDEQSDNEERESSTANWPDFLIDLARLERTIEEVFDGPGVERDELLSADQIASIPPDRWPQARLVPVVCLRLLSFKYPVNDYYTTFRKGEEPSLPEPADSHVALTRRDYIVRRYELSRTQRDLLAALVDGKPVGEAITQAAQSSDDVESFAESLQNWFRWWSAEGFFKQVTW